MHLVDVLQIAFSIIGILALHILNRVSRSLEKAVENIAELNTNVALTIERTERHEKSIDDIKHEQTKTKDRLYALAGKIDSMGTKT
jgi:HAMP domain-containing protein